MPLSYADPGANLVLKKVSEEGLDLVLESEKSRATATVVYKVSNVLGVKKMLTADSRLPNSHKLLNFSHLSHILTYDDCSSDSRDVGELRREAVEDLRQPRNAGPGQPVAKAVPGNGGALSSSHFRK